MPLFNLFKTPDNLGLTNEPNPGTFAQQQEKAGLLVTSELDKALAECKAKVDRIAKECKAKNRRFRDHEFDLENDKDRCLHGLEGSGEYAPSDVQRATQIFDKPQFFIDGADSNDIVQGAIGDCWFVSALATMSTAEGLVEKFCVARDEVVGVYGFIFFRDTNWVTVIIDDLLFTSIPKFEELSYAEKQLYHNDKSKYNESARKGSKSLYFAKSGTQGETWVPLIEKAYAKLHGSYFALSGGEACEAIEDLTGGVSCFIPSNDILDSDKFWNEELLKANKDRLFGCAYDALDSTRSGDWNANISGLIGGHAYSVLRAVEVKDRRFVVVRNPWGQTEWTGPWSDGSKEWTPEWLAVLPELGHSFGDDGQFVMEYKDFLECWQQIDRTILFDSSWVMSSQWLHVQARPLPCAWTHGDVSFTISLPKATAAIIVLSQLDTRYFAPISGRSYWTFDFMVFKKGEKDAVAESSHSRIYARSVNLEIDLDAGDYVVHVRLDRRVYREKNYFETKAVDWDQRVLSRVLTERAKSQSIAQNFKTDSQTSNLPIPINILAGQDLSELEKKALVISEEKKKKAEAEAKKKEEEEEAKKKALEAEEEAKRKAAEAAEELKRKIAEAEAEAKQKAEEAAIKETTTTSLNGATTTTTTITTVVKLENPVSDALDKKEDETAIVEKKNEEEKKKEDEKKEAEKKEAEKKEEDRKRDLKELSEDDSIFLGLRVYTNKDAPAVIGGQLRHEMEVSAIMAL